MKFKGFFVILLVVLASACASGVPVGGGWRMTAGFETNALVLTNATPFNGDISMNGGRPTPIGVGETRTIRIGGYVRQNVFVFRAYARDEDGKSVLVGLSTRTFSGGAGQTSEWTVRNVQPIR